MNGIIDFLVNNIFYFVGGVVLVILTLIGYLVDRREKAAKNYEIDKLKLDLIKAERANGSAPIPAAPVVEPINVEAPIDQVEPIPTEQPIENTEPAIDADKEPVVEMPFQEQDSFEDKAVNMDEYPTVNVEPTPSEDVNAEPVIENQTFTSEPVVENQTFTSEPVVENQTFTSEPVVENQTFSSEPTLEAGTEPLTDDFNSVKPDLDFPTNELDTGLPTLENATNDYEVENDEVKEENNNQNDYYYDRS